MNIQEPTNYSPLHLALDKIEFMDSFHVRVEVDGVVADHQRVVPVRLVAEGEDDCVVPLRDVVVSHHEHVIADQRVGVAPEHSTLPRHQVAVPYHLVV